MIHLVITYIATKSLTMYVNDDTEVNWRDPDVRPNTKANLFSVTATDADFRSAIHLVSKIA